MRILTSNEGLLYIFRDVFDYQGKVVTCQYARVLTPYGRQELIWKDCPEGSNFSDVEPLIAL